MVLEAEKEGWDDDADSAELIIFTLLDGGYDVVLEFDDGFTGFLAGDVGELAEDAAAEWVDAGDVVLHFVIIDVFPGAGLAVFGAAHGGFSGCAAGLAGLYHGHAEGDSAC